MKYLRSVAANIVYDTILYYCQYSICLFCSPSFSPPCQNWLSGAKTLTFMIMMMMMMRMMMRILVVIRFENDDGLCQNWPSGA